MAEEKNAIQCQVCGSCIRIDTAYEYIPCACGAVAVDGGPDYVRIVGKHEDWAPVYMPEVKEN